jgi:hypothetical protein
MDRRRVMRHCHLADAWQRLREQGGLGAVTATQGTVTRWITECHRQLDDLFILHQEALVQLRPDAAVELLASYRECLLLHIRFEEGDVFAAYAGLEEQGRWPASLYIHEHVKILQLLGACDDTLAQLRERCSGAKEMRRAVITLLDQESRLKALRDHHETREEQYMLPILEAQLPPSLSDSRIEELQTRWNAEMQRATNVVREIFATSE